MTRGGAGLVVAIALGDILRWQAVAGKRIGFGPIMPMAPATALLFAILGLAFGLHGFFKTQRSVRRAAFILSVFTAAVPLHVLFYHLSGRNPPWESWFGTSGLIVNGFSVGHMSAQSAVLFLCTGFSLVALFSPLARRAVFRDAGILCALLVETFALVAVVSYAAGNPPVANGGWLKIAPLAMGEFAVFNLLLLLNDSAINRLRQWLLGGDGAAADFVPASREERRFLGLLAGVGLIALAGSLFFLRRETRDYQARSIEALRTISELKISDIEQWRHERLGDAQTLRRMPMLSDMVRSLSDGSAAPARRVEIAEWLRRFAESYGYANVLVLNRAMEPVLARQAEATAAAAGWRDRVRAARLGVEVIELPSYPDGAGIWRWDLLVPVRDPQNGILEGAVLLQTNPTNAIIPILQSWPAEYQTGQSALWVHEGDRLISLGGYRPAPSVTPAELRPFGSVRVISKLSPIAARALRGDAKGGEGVDYRGVMIIGFGRAIKDSSWLFSSRLDSNEIYAPLRQTAMAVAGGLVGLLATTGFATSRLWRQRQKNLLLERIAAELEQKRLAARLGLIMQHAKDIILVADEEMRVVDANQQAIEAYGRPKEELLQMSVRDLRAPQTLEDLPNLFARANSAAGAIFETIHRRKDGTLFPVEVSVRRVEIDGHPHLLSIVRDITERRADQVRIEQLGRLYRVLSQINEVIFRANQREELLDQVCRTVVEFGQFKFAWIRWHNPQTQTLERVAQYGQRTAHLEVIRTTDQAEAMGPSGTAFRENRTYVCNDVCNDPNTIQWRKVNVATNTGSCIAVPVRLGGAVVAVLTVYAAQMDCFGKEETALLEKAAANLSFSLDTLAEKERRQASDEALRASEQRYRLIADNTSDVIWLYNQMTDQFTYASPSALQLLGYRTDEIVGRRLLDFVAPASQGAAGRALEQALRPAPGSRAPMHLVVELEQQRKDGSLVATEVVVSVLSDASGRTTHILGVTRDITERRQARETLEKFNAELEQRVELRTNELAARNREIEALLDSIPDTVLLCDETGAVISSHLPARPAPMVQATDGSALNGSDPMVLKIAREMHALAGSENQTVIQEFDRTLNGSAISIEARATRAGADRLLILIRDISARKRSEREVFANLDRERQLSEMKSQFISVASHEFRTPLAAAIGSLELLERHASRMTEAKRLELLTRIQRALGRLTTIMDDVQLLSRADSGRIKVKRMTVDLGRFVQDIVHDVEAGDRQPHEFSFGQTGAATAVPVDTNLLHHVLSNLVGNAARYSPAGTKVSVALEVGDQAFSLTVADQGIGIPEADRERIFEPFVRGSNVGQIGGTGLGLNIVKRYTELMGGRIELLPKVSGAAFRVSIPFGTATT